MLAIAWQYLTGRSVAATHDKLSAEWPPHPDRVFQALVAAWGERGCGTAERKALESLEALRPPQLAVPDLADAVQTVITAYVPVNDKPSPIKGSGRKQKACTDMHDLAIGRDRQPRSFAAVHVGETATCAVLWPDTQPVPEQRTALAKLCAAVTHVGHSRSLVRMWLSDDPPVPTWEPVDGRLSHALSLRVPHAGRLAALIRAYADGGPDWQRPPAAPWHGYVRHRANSATLHGAFDPRLVVLRKVGGDGRPTLIQAPAFVRALRGTMLAKANERAKPWISGHQASGSPLEQPHIAWLPLAYVGYEHADGHLLGLGIALPRDLPADDEQAVLDALADAMNPETGELHLTAGPAGTMDLAEDDRSLAPFALRPMTWATASPCWGTVTPIALDRLPPRRHEGDETWGASQVAETCARQGLPTPCDVRILPVSPYAGAPTARAFPPLLRKPDGAKRWHVHAVLRFAQPVEGPLLLGAGRYQGYGLCKPMREEEP